MAVESISDTSLYLAQTPPSTAHSDHDLAAQADWIIKRCTASLPRPSTAYVYASVADGIITIYGVASDRTAARDIEVAVRKCIEGAEVRNCIQITRLFAC